MLLGVASWQEKMFSLPKLSTDFGIPQNFDYFSHMKMAVEI